MRTTLFIPTKNEIDAVKIIMPQIRPEWVDEIICVDGHSRDGTAEWLEAQGYRVLRQKSDGLIGAYWECIEAASGDVIIGFSPDGNSIPETIPKIVQKMREGYDIVIASRYKDGARSADDDMVTAFGNWMFTTMANLLYRGNITDLCVMYRGFRKNLVYELSLSRSRHPMMEIELMVRGLKSGLRMLDIPADEPARIGGVRKMRIFYNGWFVLWVLLKEVYAFPRRKPPASERTRRPER
jgi:glycosyltransferase involved in cell wall biosynthesis